MPRGYPKNPKKAAKRGPKPKNPEKMSAKEGLVEKGISTSPSYGPFLTDRDRFQILTINIQTLGNVRTQLEGSAVADAQAKVDAEIVSEVKALGELRKQVFGPATPTPVPPVEVAPANGTAVTGNVPPLPSPVTLPVPSAPHTA